MAKIKNDEKIVHKASKENRKIFLRKVASWATTLGIAVGVSAGLSQVVFRTLANDLPNEKAVAKVYEESGAGSKISNWANSRFVFPRNGVVKLNVKIDNLPDHTKEIFQDCANDINTLLKIINPKYRVELNYNPTIFDGLYCINISNASIPSPTVLGSCVTGILYPTLNGEGKYSADVQIDLDKISTLQNPDVSLKNVFVHEVAGHGIFSFGDAYNYDGFSRDTIMQGVSNIPGPSFYPMDIKNALAKYVKNTDFHTWDDAVEKYYNTTEFYIKKLDDANFFKDNIVKYAKKCPYMGHDAFDESKLQLSNLNNIYSVYNVVGNVKQAGTTTKVNYEYIYKIENNEVNSNDLMINGSSIDRLGSKSGLRDLNGLTYSTSQDSYYLKYDDELYRAVITNSSIDDEKEIDFYKCGKIISKEEYEKRLDTYNKVVEKYNVESLLTSSGSNVNMYKIYEDYINSNILKNTSLVDIPNFYSLLVSSGKRDNPRDEFELSLISTGQNNFATITNTNPYYSWDAKLYPSCFDYKNMKMFSTGDCLFNTTNGLYCLNLEYDSLNGGFKANGRSGYMDNSSIKCINNASLENDTKIK